MNVHILVVSNEEVKLRNGFTGADWWFDYWDDLQIRIARMHNPEYENTLAIHEYMEAMFCRLRGVTVKQVDEFDKVFEAEHADNHGLNSGDDKDCPYAEAHSLATAPERVYAALAKICWADYDKVVGDL
jgi:hypothetical protein